MITGIEAVTYGVADPDRSASYFADWGLTRGRSAKDQIVFRTRNGAEVVLRTHSSPGLPRATDRRRSTVREITWGVRSKRALAALRNDLERDREVTVDRAGTLHTRDDAGLAIALRVKRCKILSDKPTPVNAPNAAQRKSKRATYYDRAQPSTIGHAVLNIPDFSAAARFYIERLGFHVTDHYRSHGIFIRAQARGSHHNLFLMKSRDGATHLNHVAFGVRNIHELFAGGLHMGNRGWKTSIGPGRHIISSTYFWYFRCPAGAQTEYFWDEDFPTESWKPGHFDPGRGNFAEWALGSGLPPTKALPPTRHRQSKRRASGKR